jgi:hypothetical protein
MINPKKASPMIALLLAALAMFSMATVAVAQSREAPKGPPTLQEERILNLAMEMQLNDYDSSSTEVFLLELEHYMRDGCKAALAGDWRWDSWEDIVTITYDEPHKVFLGDVTWPVEMQVSPGYRLLKVYFTNKDRPAIYPPDAANTRVTYDIDWLRRQKECFHWRFVGTEYSFSVETGNKTEMRLELVLDGDVLQYKLEKEAWYLRRVR